MQIAEIQGAAQRLRRRLGRYPDHFQQTFRTSSQELPSFAAAVLAAHAPLESGSVTVEQVVFTPKHMEALLTSYNLPLSYGRDWTITAAGQQESAALLEAALGDSIDFYFIPVPTRFQVFADHDEYATIFAATKGHLAKIATALTAAGFSQQDGYRREW